MKWNFGLWALAATLALVVWGLKKYKTIMADGKISLDEVIDTLTESESKIEDVVDAVESVSDAMEAKKRQSWLNFAKRRGLLHRELRLNSSQDLPKP